MVNRVIDSLRLQFKDGEVNKTPSMERRRNPDDWSYSNIPAVSITTRGFTMHEHLDKLNLINMNGRVYDPVMGQFLSPDPFIQNPFSTQNFNRYSYCMGNPLKYVDPSGYSYRQDMTDRYNYEGGGFWYRGSYYGYDSENGFFRSTGGGTLSGSDYHYDWGFGAYVNRFGQQASFQDVNFNFVLPNQSDFNIGEERTVIKRSQWNYRDYKMSSTSILTYDIYDVFERAFYKPLQPDFVQDPSSGIISASGQGGDPLPSWLSWTNNSINTAAFGAYAAGGSAGILSSWAVRYYSNTWKGNQYIKTFNLTKLGTNVGYGTSALGFGFGIYNFAVSDKSWGDFGQLGVSLLSSGLTLSGYTAPIGIGIGFIDVAGGFNGFYNYLDTQQQFYNSTGGVMLPVNNIPYFIPLRKP
jgi:RHS repeat-associated protein